MAARAPNQREMQEQSIKARKNELFLEEQLEAGPTKRFREYLRETPAAPLSKNVKMILWGSAAPVAFLFLGALLTAKGTSAKPPEHMVVPMSRNLAPAPAPAPAPISAKRDRKPAQHDRKPDQAVASNESPTAAIEEPPAEPKPKAAKKKGRKGRNKKGQPKAEIVKANEPAKAEPADGGEPTKAGENANAKTADANKTGAAEPSPEPPEKPKVSVFKKKKPPVFTYPKDTPVKDKPDEPEKPKVSVFKKKKPPVFTYPKDTPVENKSDQP